MKSLFYILSVLAVMALAIWAYRENHQTQQAMAEAAQLRREIRSLREALGVQRAEWAFLNRAERLSELADLNFPRLQLLPMTGQQFGRIDQIAYPAPASADLGEVIELLGRIDGAAEDAP
jgi:hypothetical protein